MSRSLGRGLRSSSAFADMTMPLPQKPHWQACSSMKARCSGWSLAALPRPSIVVILPLAAETGVTQERTGFPSISTVHAPHWARPQPNFGPFSSRSLRRTYRSGVSGATDDTRRAAPFTRNVNSAMISSGRGLVLGRLDGGSSRLQGQRAVAKESEREAGERPEQRILVAAALGGEDPAVACMAQVGREEQVNPEKNRNPSRIDAEDERQSAERLVRHDDPGEPVRQPQGCEILSGPRHPEHHGLEIEAVKNEQGPHADPQQQRSVRCSFRIDHFFLLPVGWMKTARFRASGCTFPASPTSRGKPPALPRIDNQLGTAEKGEL